MIHETKDRPANWINVENWLFDRILKKDDKILPGLRQLSGPEKRFTASPSGREGEALKVDYQDALFSASKSMIRFKKPSRLIRMIGKIINDRVGVTHCAVLIYDNEKRSYVLMDSKGAEGKKIPAGYVRLDIKNPLIEIFRNTESDLFAGDKALSLKSLNWILESGQLLTKDAYIHNKLRLVLKEMELLDAELCVPCFFKKELLGVLILGKKISGRKFVSEEINLFATLANDAAMALANARLIDSLRGKVDQVKHLCEREHRLFLNTSLALAKAIDARDIYTHGHTERVTTYCMTIAGKLGCLEDVKLQPSFHEVLYITALLHDIGKIGIPDHILHKKKRLTAPERKIIERHPEIGANILLPIRELHEVAVCIRSHQEWYNGNGYPDGLKRDEIPLAARVVSVTDAFDAITSDRPYRKKRSNEAALREIRNCSGTQFDPRVVEALAKTYETDLTFGADNTNTDQFKVDKGAHLC